MGKERIVKVNILMCILALLLCATLFSMHLVGGLYARYTTSITSSDGVRVAAFSITQEGTIFETIKADVTPGTTQSAELVITNKSEVAMEYTLTVKNVTGNLTPLKFTLSADGDTPPVTTESYENGISINSACQIPGEHTDKYALNIVWEPSDNEEDDLALIGMVDYITVSVTASQID
jgi:hypothetical protein